jgi:hypothetical protein
MLQEWEKTNAYVIGGKARRKGTAWKTKTQVGGKY